MNNTCKRQMVIWRTDANGQLGRGGEEGKEPRKKRRTQRNRKYNMAETEKVMELRYGNTISRK